MKDLSEEQLKDFCLREEIDPELMYCKECGKLLIYEDAHIWFQTRDGKAKKKGEVNCGGTTFMTKRDFNGHSYRLCRCKECVEKKFPEIKDVKFLYANKAAKYTQYAFGVSDEDFKAYCLERQSVTKEKMISKYGEEEGLERWESYCKKQSETNTFEYKHEKFGMSKEDFKKYNKSRACTRENFILRHGEVEGQRLWDEYRDRQRYTTSLDYFIEKYGDEGEERYNSYVSQLMTYSSGKANDFFDMLSQNREFEGHEVFYERKNREYDVLGYRLDFYDKTLNLVIEFNGDIWHANPEIYKENEEFDMPRVGKVKARDIWEKDRIRKEAVVNKLGCEYLVVWEKDCDNDCEKEINKIIEKIK